MSYNDLDHSVASGEPVELYDVWDLEGTHYRWTTAHETVSYLGSDYEPIVVDRSEICLGENDTVNAVDVTLSRGNTLTNHYVRSPVEGEVSLIIYSQQSEFTVIEWQGLLLSVMFDKNGIPTCRFEPRSSNSPGVGQRRRNQRLCDYILYRAGCLVDCEAYRVDGVLTNVSESGSEMVLTSSAFATKADGWFIGGEVVIGTSRRLIKAHITNTITIPRIMDAAVIGASFRAYAGCDHLPATCKAKFNNKLNYGGNENLTNKNPFEINITY